MCMYIYMYIYIHIHTHTHTHTLYSIPKEISENNDISYKISKSIRERQRAGEARCVLL